MSEMIERVGKALFLADLCDTDGAVWEHAAGREEYLDLARAALKAMREPTDKMLNEAWKCTLGGTIRMAERAFIAAIDEALK